MAETQPVRRLDGARRAQGPSFWCVCSGRREEMVGRRGHAGRVERFNRSFFRILDAIVVVAE